MNKNRCTALLLCALLPLALTGCAYLDEITGTVEEFDAVVDEASKSAEEMAHPDGGGPQKNADHTAVFSGTTGTIAVGKTLEKNGVTVTLKELILSTDPGAFSPPPDDMVFLYPVFVIENKLADKDADLYFSSGFSCKVYVNGTDEYKRSMDALFSYEGDIPQLDISVENGTTVETMSAFVIPADWHSLEFTFERGFEPRIEPLNMSFTVDRPA